MRVPLSAQMFPQILTEMILTFRELEALVPPPRKVAFADGFVFRCTEKTVQQAIVQKAARVVSGLHALRVLHSSGLYQELGTIQRCIDELNEDIAFLSLGVINNDITSLHKQYLEYFYAEEFSDPNNIAGSHVSRGMVSRDKIRAYVNRPLGRDTTKANVNSKILTKAFSGFVHAASPNIMDMFGGLPPRYDVSGETRVFRDEEFGRSALNQFYRAQATLAGAALALGREDLYLRLREAADALLARMD